MRKDLLLPHLIAKFYLSFLMVLFSIGAEGQISAISKKQAVKEGFKNYNEYGIIQIGNEFFKLYVDIELPTKYPELDHTIREVMFGNPSIKPSDGVNGFLVKAGGKRHKGNKRMSGRIPFTGRCNSYNEKFFTYEISYTTVNDSGELEAFRHTYIYNLVDGKLMDCKNIFTESVGKRICDTLNFCNSLCDINDDILTLISRENGKKITIEIAINRNLFSESFQNMMDWDNLLAVHNIKNSEEGKKGVEKFLAYKDYNKLTPHIYKINDEYYVSQNNKKIAELTEDEIKKLHKEVREDIATLQEIAADSKSICMDPDTQPMFNFKDENNFTGYLVKRMNNNYKALNLLNNTRTSNIDLTIQFIVEPDGTTKAPVMCDMGNESSLPFVAPILKQIRKSDKWTPAKKNGQNVRSIVKYRFNLSRHSSR